MGFLLWLDVFSLLCCGYVILRNKLDPGILCYYLLWNFRDRWPPKKSRTVDLAECHFRQILFRHRTCVCLRCTSPLSSTSLVCIWDIQDNKSRSQFQFQWDSVFSRIYKLTCWSSWYSVYSIEVALLYKLKHSTAFVPEGISVLNLKCRLRRVS